MKNGWIWCAAVWIVTTLGAAESTGVYRNDFNAAELDKMPDEMLVLDGGFAVKQEGTNRWVELPGAPLETYGVIFGPPPSSNAMVRARIFGTSQGRRAPTFGVGLNGQNGYRLQLAPGKKALELWKSGQVVTNVPFNWKSGSWYTVQLQTLRSAKAIEVSGRVWADGEKAPAEPLVRWLDAEAAPEGKASFWGAPYSGTPIRFDDLELAPAR